jgi:hypothetical protein
MHGQNPSRASGKPADRTERERSHSIVIASSAVIDGRADERECRATQLRAAGETIPDEDLARISPLMHQHVIPNGTYHFAHSKPGDDIP